MDQNLENSHIYAMNRAWIRSKYRVMGMDDILDPQNIIQSKNAIREFCRMLGHFIVPVGNLRKDETARYRGFYLETHRWT
jgi:hypothetical protein